MWRCSPRSARTSRSAFTISASGLTISMPPRRRWSMPAAAIWRDDRLRRIHSTRPSTGTRTGSYSTSPIMAGPAPPRTSSQRRESLTSLLIERAENRSSPDSEIRFVRGRHGGVLSGVIFVAIFRADELRPRADIGAVGDGRGPGHREDAVVFYREMELQQFAAVIGIEGRAAGGLGILLFVALDRPFGLLVGDEPV